MVDIGFTLSSEEFGPRDLVRITRMAEEAGFRYALIADHFHPWVDEQGHSPFVWVVLGAVAQATERLALGTGVTCPTMRIHPAVVAQAAASAAAILPGRFFLGVGTGENLNEHITGRRWPPYSIRLTMLKEAVEVIRGLWRGELFSHHGEYFTVENARIYTLPETPPPLYLAASGTESAAAAGEIADGLISTSADKEVVEAFTNAGGNAKPKYAQITVCWNESEKKAREIAFRIWPIAGMASPLLSELPLPSQFKAVAETLKEDAATSGIVCGPDPQKHLEEIRKYADAGFDHVYVHQIGPDQQGCIRFYEKEILPHLNRKAA